MLPKHVGAYIGNHWKGYLSDPVVCVGDEDDCWFDPDFNDIMSNKTISVVETGEMSSTGNTQVEVEVP
jgi:hypothetical protein